MSGGDLSVDIGTFTAKVTSGERAFDVFCKGECDLAALSSFEQVLKGVHDAVVSSKAREVMLDLRDVLFMNSSCLTKMIAWIGRVRELPDESRYSIRIRSSARISWQKRTLLAVQCFATDLITIETIES